MVSLDAFFEAHRRKSPRLLIGLMSGTSADGIDAALIEVTGHDDQIAVRCRSTLILPWGGLREAILCAASGRAKTDDICLLNVAIAEAFAEAAIACAGAAGVSMAEVDAVGMHGQTVWHAPDPAEIGGLRVRGSLQLGSAPVVAARTGCVVVSDFRAADLALGGQGAPLVPLADWLLFRHPSKSRAVQNLGGIGNVTFLPAGEGGVLGFDTGPCNLILNGLAGHAHQGRLTYDRDGALAAQGCANAALVRELMRDPYFTQPPPKSTGREWFGEERATALWDAMNRSGGSAADILSTATDWVAESIAAAYRAFLPPIDEVILGGGGARNRELARRIAERVAPVPVIRHEDLGWDGDFKEAVAFALLADRALQGLPGNLPGVTGASRPARLGSITLPP